MSQLEVVGIRLDPKVKARLKAEADRQQRTVSNLVAVVVTKFIDGLDHKPQKSATLVNGHAHKATPVT